MLEKIISIKGIGLLHDANGAQFALKKAVLFYADNGRGKSTKATIFRSCSMDDASLITSRSTIDGQKPQEVKLLFSNGQPVTYANGAWSHKRNEIVVFDSDFVEKNVYSGGQVTTSQRQNLLQFALGATAVTAQQAFDVATNQLQADTQAMQQLVNTLSTHHNGLTLQQFEATPALPDSVNIIADLNKQISDANNIASIKAKAVPDALVLPNADISSITAVCTRSINDIDVTAEAQVKAHLDKHNKPNHENWISTGNDFQNEDSCPYCDQPLDGIALISAYKSYFNEQYRVLKIAVTSLPQQVDALTGPAVLQRFFAAYDQACAIAATWQSFLTFTTPTINRQSLQAKLESANAILLEMQRLKEQDILASVDVDGHQQRFDLAWADFTAELSALKQQFDVTINDINSYKATLAQVNLPQLEQALVNAQWSEYRHQQSIIDLFADLTAKRAAKVASAALKQTKKDALSAIMESTLATYQTNINTLLNDFGASFEIAKLDFNFRGGGPRSDYHLEMRGAKIAMDGTAPDFRTSLSESDKRTFAFAFFIASLQADPDLAKKIVVIDDPMCSLDLNRQNHTRRVIKDIHDGCQQLIVLAHDANFLRRLKQDLLRPTNASPNDISCIRLQATTNNYSDFGSIDLEQECETPYYKTLRKLEAYLNGTNQNHDDVARSIRPLLEGYLHRRFPGKIPSGLMFGQVVIYINAQQVPSPLVHAQSITGELDAINAYAGKFHHDTNVNCEQETAVASEVRTYVQKAVNLIFKGTV